MSRPLCGTTAPSTPSKECSLTIPCVQWCQRALPGLVTLSQESTPTTLGWPLSGDVGVKTVPLERCADKQELLGALTRRIAPTSPHHVPILTGAGTVGTQRRCQRSLSPRTTIVTRAGAAGTGPSA